jgi:hypothetical protein
VLRRILVEGICNSCERQQARLIFVLFEIKRCKPFLGFYVLPSLSGSINSIFLPLLWRPYPKSTLSMLVAQHLLLFWSGRFLTGLYSLLPDPNPEFFFSHFLFLKVQISSILLLKRPCKGKLLQLSQSFHSVT